LATRGRLPGARIDARQPGRPGISRQGAGAGRALRRAAQTARAEPWSGRSRPRMPMRALRRMCAAGQVAPIRARSPEGMPASARHALAVSGDGRQARQHRLRQHQHRLYPNPIYPIPYNLYPIYIGRTLRSSSPTCAWAAAASMLARLAAGVSAAPSGAAAAPCRTCAHSDATRRFGRGVSLPRSAKHAWRSARGPASRHYLQILHRGCKHKLEPSGGPLPTHSCHMHVLVRAALMAARNGILLCPAKVARESATHTRATAAMRSQAACAAAAH